MAKDPAVLFYTADFLVGCFTMNNEQVGAYIRLLCLQHQKGHLPEEEMLQVCGGRDEAVFQKFQVDEAGRYFNPKMDEEIDKRVKFSESRRRNRQKPADGASSDEDMKKTSKSHDEEVIPPKADPPPPKKQKPPKQSYGQYGWVKLSDEEYDRLLADLGEAEVERCIQYIDESAQSSGNKNKWKDWNLVIRRCNREGWGRRYPRQQPKGGTSAMDDLRHLHDLFEGDEA